MKKIRSSNKNKTIKILFIIFTVLFALTLIILIVIGNYLYNFALNPKNDVNLFSDNQTDVVQDSSTDEYSDVSTNESEKEWLLNTSNDVFITSYDNLKLHGYELNQAKENSHSYVIIVHGYMSQAKQMATFGKNFYDMGFHILLPDLRAHGQSEGDYIGMGWHDRLDILDWIDFILSKDKDAEIVLFGVSMGAATVLMTSGESLPEQVKLIIEDCGYTSVWEQFKLQLKEEFNLPAFPILNVASMITKLRAGYQFKEASAIKQVAKCKIPILFIHGDADTFVPFSMLDPLYEAATCPKEKLVIKDAEHADSASKDPELYWNTVSKFMETYWNYTPLS